MLNDTKLKREIINNPTAEYILDNLSPVYGDGYVALNLINNLGLRMGNLIDLCKDLSKEGSPITATWSLDIWEDSLGLARNTSLSIDERRRRIMNLKVSRFSSNPYKLKRIIKDFAGLDAEIIENTARYTFTIKIFFDSNTNRIDLDEAFNEINKVKHSHIIYNVQLFTEVEQKIYYGMYAQKAKKHTIFPARPQDKNINLNVYFGGTVARKKVVRKLRGINVFIEENDKRYEVTGPGGEILDYER